jgi:membrane-associated protease RseP (regulator of RpoE activity)
MLDERDPDTPVTDEDRPRAFNRQSVGKRFAIVLAGPVANLLLAIFVYWLLNVIGVFEPRATLGARTRSDRMGGFGSPPRRICPHARRTRSGHAGH